jgi:hypothetical protein
LDSAVPIALSAALKVLLTVNPCAPSTSTVICAINCSSAKDLLPIERVAPLTLVCDPLGHVDVVPALVDGVPPPEFPPPHAARVPGIATAMTASSLRLMDVFLHMFNR